MLMILLGKIIKAVFFGLMILLLLNSNSTIANPIMANEYNPNSTNISDWVWGDITTVSTESISYSSDSNIAVDSSNNVHIVWYDYSDYNGAGIDIDIFYKKFDATTSTWGSVTILSSESTQSSYLPKMVIDSHDNIHVVWSDYTDYSGAGVDADIWYKKFNSVTNTWGSAVVVSTESDLNSHEPGITVDQNDNVHIVWYDNSNINYAGTDFDVLYKRFDTSTSTWTETTVVSYLSTGDSGSPSITTDSRNNVHVVWTDYTDIYGAGTDKDIFYRRLDGATLYWGNIELVSTSSTDTVNSARIAVDKLDNIHIVWSDNTDLYGAGIDQDIHYRKLFASTSTWGGTIILSTESISASYHAYLAIDDANNVYVVWVDRLSIYSDIVYKVYNAASYQWSDLGVVIQDSDGYSEHTSIAVDNSGFVHVSWTDTYDVTNTGNDRDVYYRKLSGRAFTPVLHQITPNPTDDNVGITWSSVAGAVAYNLYRDDKPIYSVEGMTAYATVNTTHYIDNFDQSGFYYYVITANNSIGVSDMSNMVSARVEIPIDAHQSIITENSLLIEATDGGFVSFPGVWFGAFFITTMLIRKKQSKRNN